MSERSEAARRDVYWRWGRAVFGLGVSAFFLWLALRDVDLEEASRTVRGAALLPLLAAAAVSICGLFVRGLRWSRLLSPAARGRWRTLGWSVAIGFAVNNILPARVGEFVRSVSAGRKLRIGLGVTFGSVVVEKVWDLLSAMAVIATGLLVVGSTSGLDRLTQEAERRLGIAVSFAELARNAGAAIVVIVVGVLLLKRWSAEVLRLAERITVPLPRRWRAGLLGALRGFGSGLVHAANRDVAVIAAISFALWMATGLSVWLVLGSCGIAASPATVVLVVAGLVIAVSLPGGPGYFGTYEYLAASAITMSTGAGWDRAVTAALVLHMTSYIPVTFLGLMSLVREGLTIAGPFRGEVVVNAADDRSSE